MRQILLKTLAWVVYFIVMLFLVAYTFNHVSVWVAIGLCIAFLVHIIYYSMKKLMTMLVAVMMFNACERVAPNYYGVLMENYGKNGKADYSKQQGRVNTMSPGTELFQVPSWEQRAEFEGRELHLKASDNTEFTAQPLYSYKVIENRVVDVVFQNSQLKDSVNTAENAFLRAVENNVLEPVIYDILKERSREYLTDTLMATGGNLKFELLTQKLIKEAFEAKGFELLSYSNNLDFPESVKDKIETRMNSNTNISVIDQQIIEQRKKNELALLRAQENINLSKGLTPEILQQQAIEAWRAAGCPTPQYIGGGGPGIYVPTLPKLK
jgi:hypothetical protein